MTRTLQLLFGFLFLVSGSSSWGAENHDSLDTRSVYQLESVWTNQQSLPIRLGDLRGQVQIVAMVYTRCQYSCPLMIKQLKQIETELPKESKDQVHFSLFSIDSEHETAASLLDYSIKVHLDPKYWSLFRGDADSVRELAALLGVKYAKSGSGDFTHSSIISVLDKKGVVQHQHFGFTSDTKTIVQQINQLLSKHESVHF